jgi:hypothetical protein
MLEGSSVFLRVLGGVWLTIPVGRRVIVWEGCLRWEKMSTRMKKVGEVKELA